MLLVFDINYNVFMRIKISNIEHDSWGFWLWDNNVIAYSTYLNKRAFDAIGHNEYNYWLTLDTPSEIYYLSKLSPGFLNEIGGLLVLKYNIVICPLFAIILTTKPRVGG